MSKLLLFLDKLRNIYFRSLCLIRCFIWLASLQLWCVLLSVYACKLSNFFCPKLLNIRRERNICRRLCFSTGVYTDKDNLIEVSNTAGQVKRKENQVTIPKSTKTRNTPNANRKRKADVIQSLDNDFLNQLRAKIPKNSK